ncbi:unnamed protein product [Cyprideis torosa]|uniref:dihydropyrimidinase n=1 Tax=Cyprideis torosa TaxID=163714 RepID=A0A7R8W3R8_9CRUS|nr:unnamed protein product [Cyprideis torosa]CAG0883337.1 unnamed protein product [Cyprideis torosa]
MGTGRASGTDEPVKIWIKNGTVVNDDTMLEADVFIEGGLIKQVGTNLTIPRDVVPIDAQGKYVIPGGIDTTTRFQEPYFDTVSVDDFYTGTRAALAGGTTMVMGVVVPETSENLLDAYDTWRRWADGAVCCDYALHVTLPDWSSETIEDINELVRNRGVNSFLMTMGLKTSRQQFSDVALYDALEAIRNHGALAQIHPENLDIVYENCKKLLAIGITSPEAHVLSRSEDVEFEAVQRAIMIASQVQCPLYIPQVTSRSAANAIVEAGRRGKTVIGEVMAAALGTDGTHYWNRNWRHAAAHVVNPPLRPDPLTPGHLLNILSCGSFNGIGIVGSGHCTFNESQKRMGELDFTKIPKGVNGVEDRMSIVWEKGVNSGKLDPMKFVAVTSTNAAKVFNIYPKKGRIGVGSDADIVIWDPAKTRTISARNHQQAADFNIFEGIVCHGSPSHVIANGKVVFDEGGIHVLRGTGKFIPLRTESPAVYWRIRAREGFRHDPLGPCISLPVDTSQQPRPTSRRSSKVEPAFPTPSGGGGSRSRMSSQSSRQSEPEEPPREKTPVRRISQEPQTPSPHSPQQEEAPRRLSSTRVQQPPGGKSSISFG